MLMIRTPALLLMSCLASGQAYAGYAASPPDMVGVWEGTLGKQRITACFDAGPDGAYYYARHLVPIGLDRNKDGDWEEKSDTGVWSLHDAGEDALSGEWRKPEAAADGLPISLRRVGNPSDDCRSDRFNLPLEKAFKLETKPREAYGPTYGFRRLAYLGEASVELEGSGPAMAAINRDLRQMLPHDAQRKREIFGDQRSQMGGLMSGAWDETFAEPVLWSDDFVSIEFYRWARATGANGISIEYRTYDLHSGQRVDPLTWFKGSPGEGDLPVPLLKLEQTDAECSDDRQEGSFLLELKKDSVWFWQMAPCGRELEVPYRELGPYLTPAGKAAVARLLQHPGIAGTPAENTTK